MLQIDAGTKATGVTVEMTLAFPEPCITSANLVLYTNANPISRSNMFFDLGVLDCELDVDLHVYGLDFC